MSPISLPSCSSYVVRFVLSTALAATCVFHAGASDTPVGEALSRAFAVDGRSIQWHEKRIDDAVIARLPLRGADGFEVADFDRDGAPDVAIFYEDSAHLRVAFGIAGSNAWEIVTLAEGAEVEGIEDGAVGDVNNDGWPDLLVASESGSLLYLQNPGRNVRSSTWPRTIPANVSGRGSWIRVYLADFNFDGRLEAVAVNKGVTMPAGEGSMNVEPTPVSWFAIGDRPLEAGSWQEHVLAQVVIPINAMPTDLDGDGDVDIVAGSRGEQRLFWFENTTQPGAVDISFREHALDVTGRHVPRIAVPKALSGMNMAFTDMDGDGRLDIVTHETAYSLVWLQQPEDVTAPWPIHAIGVLYPDIVTGVLIADINEDGLQDVMVGGYSADPREYDNPDVTRNDRMGRIAWFEQPLFLYEPWVRHDISRRVRGMYDGFHYLDVDGDGLGDLLATRGNSGDLDGLFWLQQVRTQEPHPVFTPAREDDSRKMPLPDSFLTRIMHRLLQ